jgi:TMEM175 potassium channel family protein
MRGNGSSNEERRRTGRRYRSDRTEGISDGVFAVSLTLLVLDLRPPEGGASQLVHGLALIAPRLGTFALSFAIVAYYWLVHHLIFASMRGVRIALIWTNMLFLFTIAVLPFSTAVLGRYPLAPVALALYGANLAACTATLAGVWLVADHSHITEQPTASHRRYIVRRFRVQLTVALLGIACAFLAPAVALGIFVALPLVFALTYHRRYY